MLDQNHPNRMLLDVLDFRTKMQAALNEALTLNEGAFDVAFSWTTNKVLIVLHWLMVQFLGTFLCIAVIKVNSLIIVFV